jgi:hypothetical protein
VTSTTPAIVLVHGIASSTEDWDFSPTCNVSQLLLPETGHLFMVHRSLPQWVDHVVNWLSVHGVAGTP